MSTLPLLDYALSSGKGTDGRWTKRQTKDRLTQFAESLVKSVLDDIERVSLFERSIDKGKAGNEHFRFDHDVAVLVRYSYEECMKQAEQVLQRVIRLEARGQRIKGAEKLRDLHGHLSAMLSVSLEDVKPAQGRAGDRKVHSLAELRHELQTRLHK